MDVEQRIVKGVEHIAVEFLVFLVGAVLGSLEPQGGGIVDQLRALGLLVFGGLLALLAFPGRLFLLYHVKIHRRGHKAAIALEHLAHTVFFEKFLFLLTDVQNHIRAAPGAAAVLHGKDHAILARPPDGRGALRAAEGFNGYAVGHHERRIKTQAKVTDDAALFIAFIVFEEFLRTGESHLIDILFHLFGGHADAVIAEGQLPFLGIQRDRYTPVLLGSGGKHLLLGNGVAAIGHHLTDKNILVGIQPPLDDRHNVLRMNRNIALLTGHDSAS